MSKRGSYFLFEALASHPEIGAAFGRKLVEIILRRSPEKVKVVAVFIMQRLTQRATTRENACNNDLAELHKMVSRVRMDEEVELEYMKIFEREEMIREDGCMLQFLRLITKKIAKGKSR